MNNNNLTSELKNFFSARGVSQSQLADDLDVSQQYISRLLTGVAPFGKKTATRFSELYGLSVPWLLTGEGPMMAADVQTGNSVSVITHGDNSPAAGGDQRITTEGTDDLRELREEVKNGFAALKTEISSLKAEVSALKDEKGRLLSIIENLTGGANK